MNRFNESRKLFPNITNDWDLQAAEVSYQDGLLRITVPPAKEAKAVKELNIK